MPRAPKKCGHTDCETRVVGAPYCPRHRTQRQWATAGQPHTGTSRTSTAQWKRIRSQARTRDGNRCVQCGADGRTTQLFCDHITPVAEGGTDTLSNAQMLCKSCHDPKTQAEAQRGRGIA